MPHAVNTHIILFLHWDKPHEGQESWFSRSASYFEWWGVNMNITRVLVIAQKKVLYVWWGSAGKGWCQVFHQSKFLRSFQNTTEICFLCTFCHEYLMFQRNTLELKHVVMRFNQVQVSLKPLKINFSPYSFPHKKYQGWKKHFIPPCLTASHILYQLFSEAVWCLHGVKSFSFTASFYHPEIFYMSRIFSKIQPDFFGIFRI